ncbi:hypothetical protein [Bacillus toyonensis]|uniref:hypothetical protein n=1 Tax=Bacillus toyonensis TaxID=155322 RepID=UPI00211D6711|nr:hypothetical protein [Bacillus toyonensis]
MLTQREILLDQLRGLKVENKVLLFVAGVKPALTSARWSPIRELLEANFPFIPLKQKRTGKTNMNLYFQTEEQKKKDL